MSRKSYILATAIGAVCCIGASKASAQFLAGNVWPNPGLSVPAAPGVDQVYSYYNGTYSTGGPYQPNTSGDTNPRPAGWHRGGGDFATTTTPSFCFYNSPGPGNGIEGEGNAPPGNSDGYALEVSDSSAAGYGEWFSDFNALPAASVGTGTPITVQFYWQYNSLASIQKGGDQFRVSVDFADSVGDDTLTAPNTIGPSVDDLLQIPGTPDQPNWTLVDETIVVPAGAQAMRITVDSGGSSDATGNIWVSDISVASAVPEPTSLGLLSAGALLLGRRRRRA